jgi:hypothetical protein
MGGNAWEWVWDFWDVFHYRHAQERNPRGPDRGKQRAIRGGCWNRTPFHVRVADRDSGFPVLRNDHVGFRCADGGSAVRNTSRISASSVLTSDLDGDGAPERTVLEANDVHVLAADGRTLWSWSETRARCRETTDRCSASCRDDHAGCLTGPKTCTNRYESCVRQCGNRTGCADLDDLGTATSLSTMVVDDDAHPILVATQPMDGGAELLVHLLGFEGGKILSLAQEVARPPEVPAPDRSGRDPVLRFRYERHSREGYEVLGKEVVLRWIRGRFARIERRERLPGNPWPEAW